MTAKQVECQSRALDKQIKQCDNKCQQVYSYLHFCLVFEKGR